MPLDEGCVCADLALDSTNSVKMNVLNYKISTGEKGRSTNYVHRKCLFCV